jgi:Holliday junction DNA helicase RuvA
MIALLTGRIVEKVPSRVIVDVSGVGYDVLVPLSTFYVLGDAGAPARLRIHTHVREDVIALYGFATALEQELFERLIAIGGVGPKLALAVLSGIEPAELIRAIRGHDVERLTRIPGVGKKTAERIVVELRDKLAAIAPHEEHERPASRSQLEADVLSALENLGYDRRSAERALEAAREGAAKHFEDLLKESLQQLSGTAKKP